jgi:hypothetical protein
MNFKKCANRKSFIIHRPLQLKKNNFVIFKVSNKMLTWSSLVEIFKHYKMIQNFLGKTLTDTKPH